MIYLIYISFYLMDHQIKKFTNILKDIVNISNVAQENLLMDYIALFFIINKKNLLKL